MSGPTMDAAQAGHIVAGLDSAGVRCWVMGGWGVDALLGRVTREHHDLDLLVHVDDIPTRYGWMRDHDFAWSYDWDESRPVGLGDQRWSTAFVAAHPDRRELDVHGIDLTPSGHAELATGDLWQLPADTLSGRGLIDGRQVACFSREAQVAMHRGYELPPHHVQELALLDR